MSAQTNLDRFVGIYRERLTANVSATPEEYAFGLEKVPAVVERMSSAIRFGTFNKDSASFRQTCQTLGIPHTYKAIKAFVSA